MALGIIKRVFSFGTNEVVEAPAEDEPLAPINWAALDALKAEGQFGRAQDAPPPAAPVAPPLPDEPPSPMLQPDEAPAELPPAPSGPPPAAAHGLSGRITVGRAVTGTTAPETAPEP